MPNVTCLKVEFGSDDWNYLSNSNNWITKDHQQHFTKYGGIIWRYMCGYYIKLSTHHYDFLPVDVNEPTQEVFYIHIDRVKNIYTVGGEYLSTTDIEMTYTEMLKELHK